MSKRTMAEILIQEAPVWGVRLERRADKLVISPASKCNPDFKELLRAHKFEIMDLLQGEAEGLKPDERPWLSVSKQVLAGEFDGADESTRESLAIGLRGIGHPTCQAALARLMATPQREKRE